MPRYKVTVPEVMDYSVLVDADNPTEAKRLVEEGFNEFDELNPDGWESTGDAYSLEKEDWTVEEILFPTERIEPPKELEE